MIIYSFFFLYCLIVQNRKFRSFGIPSLMLVAITFIVWVKVTTDIFFIDALLFCIVGDYEGLQEDADASRILPDEIGLRRL